MSNTTIQALLHHSSKRLSTCSDTPKLDAELLLAAVLEVSRTYLHTYPEKNLNVAQYNQFENLVARCEAGEPVAYILGHKDFWTITLEVTRDTLIPRPETELLVELALQKLPPENIRIADLGTGSGAIALAVASERPQWEVWATDKMPAALAVAQRNARCLGIRNVTFHLCEWCASLPQKYFHCIVSNPPYITTKELVLLKRDLSFEPETALVAGKDGLQDIKIIILQARSCLVQQGWLMIEHGYEQAHAVMRLLQSAGFQEIANVKDISGHPRITVGSWHGS